MTTAWEQGDGAPKKADIRDVAQAAGVSISTVSRVLSGGGATSEKTREKVRREAERLGYRPNVAGRALRTRESGSVALMISSINNSFYAAIATEIEQQLSTIGHVTLFGNTNEDPELQDQFLQEVTSRSVSAVVMLCAVASDKIERLAGHQPCVLLNRRLAGLEHCPFVGIDDRLAAGQLAAAMVARGGREIGLLGGPAYSLTSAARTEGLLERLDALGIEVPRDARLSTGLSIDEGYQAAAEMLRRRPDIDALFCGNDQIAYGAWRRCRELGIDVPGRLRLYGFDDNPLTQWLAPWLDTVRVPTDAYARETLRMLRMLWAGEQPHDVIVPYELVLRS